MNCIGQLVYSIHFSWLHPLIIIMGSIILQSRLESRINSSHSIEIIPYHIYKCTLIEVRLYRVKCLDKYVTTGLWPSIFYLSILRYHVRHKLGSTARNFHHQMHLYSQCNLLHRAHCSDPLPQSSKN